MEPWLFGAQMVNFLILVFLLRRFLYRPLLRVMDERERRLAERRTRAEAALAEAAALREQAAAEVRSQHQAREEALARARAEAEERRQALLEEVRREVSARRDEWLEELRRRQAASAADLRPRLARAVAEMCRRALEDLAGTDLESRMAALLARRLRDAEDLRDGTPVRVTSSLPLDGPARDALTAALPTGVPVDFVTAPGPPGLTVASAGWEVSWSASSYAEALEQRVAALLEEGSARVAAG